MKSRGFTIVEVVITICVLAIIASFGYVWWHNQQTTPSSINHQASISAASATPIITTKIYTDTKYGYTIHIPVSWQVETNYSPNRAQSHTYEDSVFSSPSSDTNFIIITDAYSDGICDQDVPSAPIQSKINGITYSIPGLCGNEFALSIKMPDGLVGYIGVTNTQEALTALSTLTLNGIQIIN